MQEFNSENDNGVSKIVGNIKNELKNTHEIDFKFVQKQGLLRKLFRLLLYPFFGSGGILEWISWSDMPQFVKELENEKYQYDVIHLVGSPFSILWKELSLTLRSKAILQLVDNGMIHSKRHGNKNVFFKLLKKLEFKKKYDVYKTLNDTEVVFVSRRDSLYFKLTTKNDALAIENGVSEHVSINRRFDEATLYDSKLVFHGDLTYKPNIEALELLSGLDVKNINCIGRYSEAASKRYKNLIFRGFVDDLIGELAKFDIYVCPIFSGAGIKNKILEAALVGLPIIATKEATIGTGFKDGVHYVRAESLEDFNCKIATLNHSSTLRKNLSENAKDYILSHLTWPVAARKYERLYRMKYADSDTTSLRD